MVLYTGTRFLLHHPSSFEKACPFSAHSIREILTFSLPLSTNRVCLSLLQSAESICIPLRLQAFGLARSAALSSYGTLTGMALPLVLFPSAVTNASLLCCCRLSPNHRLEKTAKRSQDFLSAPSRAACCLASSVPFSFWSLEICAESCFLTATRPELTSRSSPGSVRSSILAQRLPVFKRTWKDLSCLPVKYGCAFYKIFIRLVCHSFFRYQRLSARTAFFTASAQPAVAFLPEPQFILKCCQVSVVCFLYKKHFPDILTSEAQKHLHLKCDQSKEESK